METHEIIRLPKVRELTGLSDSSIWRREKKGTFPMRRDLGGRAVGWFLDEVLEWNKNTKPKKPNHHNLRSKEPI